MLAYSWHSKGTFTLDSSIVTKSKSLQRYSGSASWWTISLLKNAPPPAPTALIARAF